MTVVSGTGSDGHSFSPGENIYGPFEAGFGAAQDTILAKLGCATGQGYVDGGMDTLSAESVVSQDCGVVMPRWEGSTYVSLLDECGGHTQEYHFHERMTCLDTATTGHSDKLGEALVEGYFIYGMYEDVEAETLPELDACGGHYGTTPDCDWCYHYHVQSKAPFTFGCFGPNKDDTMITLAQCRALYPEFCGDGDDITITVEANEIMGWTKGQELPYDLWCPCYDADGSNVGTEPLAFESATNPHLQPGADAGEEVVEDVDEEDADADAELNLEDGPATTAGVSAVALALAGVVGLML